ncbi:MAG: hypothetical protein EWV55_16080 [Microcystis viridis Mv_BB_P_19951000_S69]|uniref:Uncharacterized protein n=1 Tax=Microcystis viridis Mv_BB_P_19951000_S68D TaxID=2486270 RepID=A0A552HS69_MICVR|nr:MAG: hypothetical protein EWV55_16080 [Microcystis viridis Mv_BB_P_19951000_S69]TRU74054.1 MAG: hypothetical protein EWV77_10765 [Microcystis viridis Mv_BB_P_19951000_S68D]TRU78402.1 MAG: hypothetical protein EWV47_02045 [Microcystis viridis Mv_BB_P_19951000_S68]TRU85192.1 MAG: hypothetical protein EWV46_12900 [Microcystis viridis Mv_BB_P_19951000_S69D]
MNDPSDNLKERKLQAEIEKINAEKNKILQEAENLKKTTIWSLRANFVSIIGGVFIGGLGILALITGSQQMALQEKLVETKKQEVLDLEKKIKQKSQEIRQQSQKIQQKSQEIKKQQENIDEKKKAYDDLQKSYAELVKTKNELAKALNRTKLETQGIVYIQFQGSLERNSMKELAKLYQQKGFQAPGVERIAGNYRNEVRFNPSDAELASQVATIAQNFFDQKSCPIENIKLNPLKKNNNVPKGQIELWIHHSCK